MERLEQREFQEDRVGRIKSSSGQAIDIAGIKKYQLAMDLA